MQKYIQDFFAGVLVPKRAINIKTVEKYNIDALIQTLDFTIAL
jgi:hypothetical protein